MNTDKPLKIAYCRIRNEKIIAFPNNKDLRKSFLLSEEKEVNEYVSYCLLLKKADKQEVAENARQFYQNLPKKDRKNIYFISSKNRLMFQYRRMTLGKITTHSCSIYGHGPENALQKVKSNRAKMLASS